MVRRPRSLPVLACLAVVGCTIPGVETSRVVSRGVVEVAGRTCESVTREHSTPTVNGMHRYSSTTLTCDGRRFDCGAADGNACAAQVAAALAGG